MINQQSRVVNQPMFGGAGSGEEGEALLPAQHRLFLSGAQAYQHRRGNPVGEGKTCTI
jgi:hypothetical protein